jgi:multisubunit Na+/H+ antiporter MnhB subunit
MHELLDIATFEHLLIGACIALTVAGIVLGVVLRRRASIAPAGVAALALIGPVVYVGWVFYSWMVRYDPQTGYVGLHKVSVLLINVGVFVVLGIVAGLVARKVGTRSSA